MRWMIVTAALLAASCASARAEGAGAAWLSGYWLTCEGGTETSETWVEGGGGLMLGLGVTRGERSSFEYTRISPSPAGLSFFGSPEGAPATEFPLKTRDGQRLIFENLAHDFPNRVIYERRGDALHARIEGDDSAMDWNYRRAALGTHC